MGIAIHLHDCQAGNREYIRLLESLFVRIRPPFPVTCCFLTAVYLAGTIGTILGTVGFCQKRRTTFCASLQSYGTGDFSLKSRSTRQNPNPEPSATQRIGDALYTDTGLAIIQRNTIAAVIIAAGFSNQRIGFSSLLGCHLNRQIVFPPSFSVAAYADIFPCAFLHFM